MWDTTDRPRWMDWWWWSTNQNTSGGGDLSTNRSIALRTIVSRGIWNRGDTSTARMISNVYFYRLVRAQYLREYTWSLAAVAMHTNHNLNHYRKVQVGCMSALASYCHWASHCKGQAIILSTDAWMVDEGCLWGGWWWMCMQIGYN